MMMQEIREKQDLHANNQKAFGLPSRLVAKVLVFRILYGGGAYSFANDSDFTATSTSVKYWERAIEAFYDKYKGVKIWHETLIQTAQSTGRLEIPSGRFFPISPMVNKWNGGLDWPITVIKNYPVQGFGADLVMLARLRAAQLFRERKHTSLLCGTIHDSLVADCPLGEYESVAQTFKEAIEEVPDFCKRIWGYNFSLPLKCEVSYGMNKTDMKEIYYD